MPKSEFTKEIKVKQFSLFMLLLGAFYIITELHSPLIIAVEQSYDDMLFINHAQSLAEGRWLGKFSELTLVKGPGYPLFLAVNYWIGLPITFTRALFYCVSLVPLTLFVLKTSKSYVFAALLFLFTLWDPRVFEMDRILRDAIYSGQSVLVLTIFSFSLFCKPQGKYQDKLSSVSGLLLGWFWLTREEGIWLIPGLVYLVVFAFIRNKNQLAEINLFRSVLITCVFSAVTHIAFGLGNLIAYGEFIGVDIKEKNFQSVVKSMESVRIGDQIPYLAVPRNVRMELYQISPAFAELKKYIDPDKSVSRWEKGGCLFRPTTCGDIGNGFFLWALREAAGKAGHYSSPAEASKFYALINTEIQDACRDKRLRCEKNYIPYMPPITLEQFQKIPSVFKSIWNSLSSAGILSATPVRKIWGPEYVLDRALSVLNNPAHYPMSVIESNVELAGWYRYKANDNDWLLFQVIDNLNNNLTSDVSEKLDLAYSRNGKGEIQKRFKINTKCSDGCKLTFNSSQGAKVNIPIKDAQKLASSGDLTLMFDYIRIKKNSVDLEDKRVKFSFQVRLFIHDLYKVILPMLLIMGIVAFVFSSYLSIKKSDYSVILAIAGACWIAISVRAIILVLVDIASFPSVILEYMQPIYVLSIVASILSIGMLINYLPYNNVFDRRFFNEGVEWKKT